MLGTKKSPASGDPWNGVQTATSPSSPSGALDCRARLCRRRGAGRGIRGIAAGRGLDRGGRRRAGRDEQMLADQAALAVRDEHAAGGGGLPAGERAPQALGGLDDAASVHAQPVHDSHTVPGGVQRVAEGPQERPVLVDAGEQDDLGELVRSRRPRAGRGARPAECPRDRDDRELTDRGVGVVQAPPPAPLDQARSSDGDLLACAHVPKSTSRARTGEAAGADVPPVTARSAGRVARRAAWHVRLAPAARSGRPARCCPGSGRERRP